MWQNQVISDVAVVISEDLKHDMKAIQVFTERVLPKLEEKGCSFHRLIQWTDSFAAQYK